MVKVSLFSKLYQMSLSLIKLRSIFYEHQRNRYIQEELFSH